MLWTEFFVPFIFTLAAIFYSLLGLYAWRKRPAAGVVSFAWIMLCMSIWSFAYGLEVFFPLLEEKLLVMNVEYIGILGVPVFLFFFSLDFTGRSHLLTKWTRALIWAFPIVFLLLVWTNPLHYLMWDSLAITQSGMLNLLSVRFGPASWAQIGFSFLLVIAACILLIMDFLQHPGSLRLHISLVILAILFSLFGSSTFLLGISPSPGLDFTPLFFLPTAIGLSWVTLRYRLSEVLSLEHITVLKNMRDGVIVLNDQKRILYINPVTENLLKFTEDKAIGQPFHSVAEQFAHSLNSYLTGEEYHTEIEIEEGGETKIFEVSISPSASATPGVVYIVITLHDITQRKEKEQELSRHGMIMSAISRAAEQFLKASNWEQNISDVLENLGLSADVSRVYVVVNETVQGEEIISSLKHEWSAPGFESQLNNSVTQNVPMRKTGFSRWIEELSAGHLIHGSVRTMPNEERGFLNQLGILSVAVAPVFVDGEWWGFLMFDECRHERHWTYLEMEAFQIAASIFGSAETRARTEKKLAHRQLAMSLLQEIVTVSLRAANMQEMAEVVANRLAELIGADGCFLTLWNETNHQTIPIAAYGALKHIYPTISIQPGEKTFTKSALELERTLIIEDANNTPYATPAITQMFPIKSVLALPLIAMEKKLGAVLVAFEEYHRFDQEEVQICEQAASLIALALEKFQAMEDAHRRANTSETLRKAGIAIAEQLELRQAVNHVLEQLKQMVPYDSASVQLLEDSELHIIGGNGWKDEKDILNLRFPIPGDNPNTIVMERGAPYYLPDARIVYEKFRTPPHDHIRSWLGIPLIVHEKTIGLLAVDSSEPNDFSEQEIMIATEFANQVAITLENARILKETQNQAITDTLTGIYNRRGLYQFGELEFQRSRRINRPFSIIMFDIDHFKQINDQYGHAAGDQVLHQLAQRCVKTSRTTDLIGRYGGEEFIILLTETNLEAAKLIGERLRQSIMKTPFITDAGRVTITSSLGIAEAKPTDTLNTLIQRADAALYHAKNAGRNQVITLD
ncbi:MAG: histidine kinase N-terminal 7TM domain-containing protein [Anaerolineales bacterium]